MSEPYFWDRMYDVDAYRYGTDPNAFLVEVTERELTEPATALCIGDGEGRNGVWLATQGHGVTMVEPSEVGVRKARELATERGVDVTLVQEFFPTDTLGDTRFDLVALIYIHLPGPAMDALYRAAAERVAPGGLLVVEGFHPDQITNKRKSGGPKNAEMLLTAERLKGTLIDHDATELELVTLEKVTVELREGPGHSGVADVTRLVARRR